MIEVTADSNIYISALVFGGRALEFIEAARNGQFRLVLSEPLLIEILRVLQGKFGWSALTIDEARELIEELTVRVEPTEAIEAVVSDPDDNRVLECAIAAGSRLIVTGDGDLLRLGHYRDVSILRLADFLALMTSIEPPDSCAS